NLSNQKLCLGNNFELNLNNSHNITGSPTHIQWQHRQETGTDWTNLKDSANFSGTNSLHLSINNLTLENQKQYRCSVLFNSSTGTCSETTDLMSLSVGSFPQTPENKGFEYCQNVSSPKLELYEPNDLDVIWYLPGSQNALSKQPIIDTKIAGNQIYFYSFKNSADCESPKASVQIIIHPEPPKPINTTPSQVTEGQTLVFSATGENLKWYTSRTGKTFMNNAPSYQKIGNYDHYVSQTSPKGCESDRGYIESEIITAFGIVTQPLNQANCEDNTSTFSIKTKGSTIVIYRWQILKNGIFEDILGENTSSLKIDDVGKAPHVDGTVYRCIVSNSIQEIISNEVTLKVNKIDGKLSNLSMCENVEMNALKFKENLVGNIAQIEWQRKETDTYNTIFISKRIEDNIALNQNISGDYRLRITFQNQGSSTCIRTSNTLKITINKKPEPLEKINYTVCQYSPLKTILKQFPANYALRNLDSTLVNFTHFNDSKSMSLIGNYSNEKGCSSDFQKLNFDILEAPKVEVTDTTLTYCQFSNELKSLKINNLNTFWFSSETDDESTENAFSISTSTNQTHYRWLAIENPNGCLSQKTKIKIYTSPCFYNDKKDTCLSQSGKSLVANEWNYFYDANGKIFAAVHPAGQNLGSVKMDFRNTSANIIKDKNQTNLYPRYFNILTSQKINSDFKIRFYMTLEEISKMGAKTTEDVSIINYGGKNQDCDLLNNALEDNYWLETDSRWDQESQQNIYFVEFNTQKTGEFGLWNSVPSTGILSGKINDVNIPDLNISEKSNAGKYIILKSKDGKSWFEWTESSEKTNFLDLKPFIGENYYQLIYDYGNGIKSIRNTVKLHISSEYILCQILENPSENRNLLKIYFPDIDKTSVRLNTAMGQFVGINKILNTADYLEIHPITQLSTGFYTFFAQNNNGKSCALKVWIK
nr:hypothetical protein [Leadbetterella sp.]